MIDLHAHILPGIDDGAEDLEESVEMARVAASGGMTAMVATPHCNIPGGYKNYFDDTYVRTFEKTKEAIQKAGIEIQLLPGMEVYATYDLPELIVDKKIMPINRSRYILIEFDFDEDPEFADHLLARVNAVGAKPVIAHAERYKFVQQNPQIVYNWRKKGYLVQANKASYMGKFGESARKVLCKMLKHNLISVMASDAHGAAYRTPYMMDAYKEMYMEYSGDMVNRLFRDNPWYICENMPIWNREVIPFEVWT